ncbi:MAG: thiamine biosynthesis protein ThiS [Marinilabiliales bacterium]|nr:MAG: thiamine biosynthesis protein ThiS [Marinilabiliales bacterium]
MVITLNNREEIIENKSELTIQELLDYKAFSFKMLVIKVNGTLIPRDKYENATVKEGDNVTILHLMSGG